MASVQKLVARFNKYQQKHRFSSFIVAVIKKYSDDKTGQRAALLTYYAFLSLFPLLLILTTLANTLMAHNSELKNEVIKGLTDYFPLLGNQLSSHVHSLRVGGLALISGLLILIYGTRGVADSFRHSVQSIWLIPEDEQDKFPKSLAKSIALIIIGGFGFIAASILAGIAAASGRGVAFRLLSLAINLFILFWLFRFLISFSLPRKVRYKSTRLGAAVATIGLVILQSLGTYILARELKRLDALYSYFAVALGLLFWLYLQTQVLYYAIQIAVVSSNKLWPRSLEAHDPTDADKRLTNFYDK